MLYMGLYPKLRDLWSTDGWELALHFDLPLSRSFAYVFTNTEVTKLCHMFGSGPDLKTHVPNFVNFGSQTANIICMRGTGEAIATVPRCYNLFLFHLCSLSCLRARNQAICPSTSERTVDYRYLIVSYRVTCEPLSGGQFTVVVGADVVCAGSCQLPTWWAHVSARQRTTAQQTTSSAGSEQSLWLL